MMSADRPPLPPWGTVPTRPRCGACRQPITIDYHATDELWEAAVHPSDRSGYLCLPCLISRADEKLLPWDRHLRDVRFLSLSSQLEVQARAAAAHREGT